VVNGPENANYAYVGAVIDELVRSGVHHLCVCPGSRSTPLAISAVRHPGMRVWTLIDERSAGFFAMGMAKALREPVAALSTSGTAAANFFPAVIEAKYGRVPLVVLTADRPRELRDCGAPQTIAQDRLYGVHAKWFVDIAPPGTTDELLRYARMLACQAVAVAREGPPGPVHLNIPLGDPLVPTRVPAELPATATSAAATLQGRQTGRPFTAVSRAHRLPDSGVVGQLAEELGRCARGVIVCGPQDDPGLPDAVSGLARVLGYPVLADPLSQVRCGSHERGHVIDSYDAILRVEHLADALIPDVILRFGGVAASRSLGRYLQRHARTPQIVVDGDGGWNDPMRVASQVVHADARLLSDALAAACAREAADAPWLALWRRLDRRARQAMQAALERLEEPFEGKVFAELSGLLGAGATLYVGNSMPVRDLDTFFPGTSKTIRFLANRGASGIDGVVSSALGAAAAHPGPLVLVLGDLAFYHDMNGLLAAKLHRLRATVVLLHNDGGGIFSFLPQADYPEYFEALFGTPTGLDFRVAAELYGAGFSRADTWDAFRNDVREGLASERLQIVEVRTGRARNLALHQEVSAAVEHALRAGLPAPSVGQIS
jgi:2-succinyl-5-enolpyruvyl-6-hydroxy-3-cyclohexene-1-carboxylate synthase